MAISYSWSDVIRKNVHAQTTGQTERETHPTQWCVGCAFLLPSVASLAQILGNLLQLRRAGSAPLFCISGAKLLAGESGGHV